MLVAEKYSLNSTWNSPFIGFFVLFHTLSFHPTNAFRFRQLTDSYVQHFSTPLHLVMGKDKL
jgi:hypothetical protein